MCLCAIPPKVMLVALLCLAVIACDRPFVEVSGPEIEVVEPDLSVVLESSRVDVAVRATSFRGIERVELNGGPLTFNQGTGLWETSVQVGAGVTDLIVSAFDTEDVSTTDTLVAVYVPFSFSINAPDLPQQIGNHAAVLTAGGSLLVTGGAFAPTHEALEVAFISSPAGAPFQRILSPMITGRMGHTMLNLPGGDVLIVGGALRGVVSDVLGLVETAERFDVSAETFFPVTVVGDPIRRADHTASARGTPEGFIVDLFGGRGDIQYGSSPVIGIRQDIRSFIFRNDSLIALHPGVGPFLAEPISGHTQTRLKKGADLEASSFVIHGTHFGTTFFDSISFLVDFADRLGLNPIDVGPTVEPRTEHASANLTDGLVATFGGIRLDDGAVLGRTEVFVGRIGQFIPFSPRARPAPFRRYGHTATKIAEDRIILVGGFAQDGNSISLSEYFVFDAE